MKQHLEGPCRVCGGYFPSLAKHIAMFHPQAFDRSVNGSTYPGVCPRCKKWADDLKAHLEWHENRHWLAKLWGEPW